MPDIGTKVDMAMKNIIKSKTTIKNKLLDPENAINDDMSILTEKMSNTESYYSDNSRQTVLAINII